MSCTDQWLHGPVLDDCRHIITNASNINVTKDAVDDNNGCQSITLVPHSAIVVVSNDDTT